MIENNLSNGFAIFCTIFLLHISKSGLPSQLRWSYMAEFDGSHLAHIVLDEHPQVTADPKGSSSCWKNNRKIMSSKGC